VGVAVEVAMGMAEGGRLVAAGEPCGSGTRRAALVALGAAVVVQGLGMLVVVLLGLTVPMVFLLPLLLLWGGLLVLGAVAWTGVRRRAWPAWAAWLALAIPAVDVAAVFLVLVVVPGALYCGGAERAVLAEFSHYRGVKAEASGELGTGACTLGFTTGDPAGAVVAYYRAQLTARGWTVRDGQSGGGAAEGGGQVVHGELGGTRSGAVYQVVYEEAPGVEGRATAIAIRVRA